MHTGESGSPGMFLIDEDVPASTSGWPILEKGACRYRLRPTRASNAWARAFTDGSMPRSDRRRLRVVEVLARPLDLTRIDAFLLEAAGQGARPSARAQQNHHRGGGHL